MAGATSVDPRFAEPDCLFWCIGAQKSGTSWLHSYLADHPQVCVPRVRKELQYWNHIRAPFDTYAKRSDIWSGLHRRAKRLGMSALKGEAGRRKAREWAAWERSLWSNDPSHRDYAETLFAYFDGERAVGEVSPEYAHLDSETLAEMASLSPKSRMIYIMRDPIDRMFSGIRFALSKGKDTVVSPTTVADRVAQAIDGDDPHRDLRRTRYDRVIGDLDSVLPPDRVAYFFYETLFTEGEIDRLTSFLDLDPMPADFDRKVWVTKGRDVMPGPEVEARVRDALRPVYRFVEERFGMDVPGVWHHSVNTVSESESESAS
ncbi:MAG: sulfotransferase [Pseudomonadota bacterium]